MPQTLFGIPLKLTDAFEDGSVYTYYLKDGGKGGGAAAAAGGPAFVRGVAAGVGGFRSNLVVVREPQGGRDLDKFADEQRASIAERMPVAKSVKEGKTKVAGLEAREQEFAVTLEHPMPALTQWHAWLVRDGYCYHLCATSPRERAAKEQKEFKALLDSWK